MSTARVLDETRERLGFVAESLADVVEAVARYECPERDVPELAKLATLAKWTLAPAGYHWSDQERRFIHRPKWPVLAGDFF